MKCATWNVNGIRALVRKDLAPWSVLADCDVLCLQETKAQPDQVPEAVRRPDGWHSFWHSAPKKGYAGGAVYCRPQPAEALEGLGVTRFEDEGRLLAVRFGRQLVVSAYFPNSQGEGRRLDYKLAFCAAMEKALAAWRKRRLQVLLMGDFNIAHRPIDLARPKENENNAGYLPEERAWFSRFAELGWVDVFRSQNPDLADAYTWWSYRGGARRRNVGWRLDYATADKTLAAKLGPVQHHSDIMGSDHCPVSVRL